MKRIALIISCLFVFACGVTYCAESKEHCDSVFYHYVLLNFNENTVYVPLRIKMGNDVFLALNTNSLLSCYIEMTKGIKPDSNYVVYMTKILENHEIIEMNDSNFKKYCFRKVSMDTNLEKEVEKNRNRFIRRYFDHFRYSYYVSDYESNSDSIVYKVQRKRYFIKQDIPRDKQLCIIYLLLERNVSIYTLDGYDGEIGYIGPYKDFPDICLARMWRIKGKKDIRQILYVY